VFEDEYTVRNVADRLADHGAVRQARIHPYNVLVAKATYEAGRSHMGTNGWKPHMRIVDALEAMFYASFSNVAPTGKSTMLCLDVSSSMNSWGYQSRTTPPLSPRQIEAAMAMVTLRAENDVMVGGFSREFVHLDITAEDTLAQVISKIGRLPFGRTDCGAPMEYARRHRYDVDAFIMYTDNETGRQTDPVRAMRGYRESSGINAKLIVNAMTATNFTIADPNDPGMLDVVGFDSAAPQVMANFIAN